MSELSDKINSQGVSFIISARNEFPNISHTVNSLMLDTWQSGIDNWEIIIADNASTDQTSKFFLFAYDDPYAKEGSRPQRPRELKFSPRGITNEHRLRFIYDPVFSNVGARDKAVPYAKYKNIIFADAHIGVKPGTVLNVLETLDTYGGVVHTGVSWMGASIYRPHAGMQYSYKIGEKIFGTWNFAQASSDHPFYIPVSGHCFLAVKKEEYMRLGGYDTHQRVYGGGENYLDTLYWMLGSNVMTDPRGLVFHLSSGRGYSYDVDSLIYNMMLTAYTLGGHKWSERILITYLDKPGTSAEYLDLIYKKAISDGQEKRDFIEKNQVRTLEETLGLHEGNTCDGHCYKNQKHVMRPWDVMNDALVGKHISFVTVFEDWLDRLQSDRAKEFYRNSPHQK